MSCSGDGFGGDEGLEVISVAVEVETMATYDVTKGQQVEDDYKKTKHRTLGNR